MANWSKWSIFMFVDKMNIIEIYRVNENFLWIENIVGGVVVVD